MKKLTLTLLLALSLVSLHAAEKNETADLAQGLELIEAKNIREAYPLLFRAREQGADRAVTTKNMAYCLAKMDRHEEAIHEYREALKLDADDPWMKIGLAASLIATEKDEEAQTILLELSARDDEWGKRARRMRAMRLAKTDKHEEAVAAFVTAIKDDHRDLQVNWAYALSLMATKDYEGALSIFRRISKGVADPSIALLYEAQCLERLGKKPEAEVIYEELAVGESKIAASAQTRLDQLTGKWYSLALQLSAGYDNGLLSSDEREKFIDDGSLYLGTYLDGSVRVMRTPFWRTWLGAMINSSHYPSTKGNDYVAGSGNVTVERIKPGPFEKLSISADFNTSFVDSDKYSERIKIAVSGSIAKGKNRYSGGAHYTDVIYMDPYEPLSGFESGGHIKWLRYLPGPAHSVSAYAAFRHRSSSDPTFDRDRINAAITYRKRIWKRITGELKGTYHRDDFYNSDMFSDIQLAEEEPDFIPEKRVDDRIGAAFRIDSWLTGRSKLDIGILYEARYSLIPSNEYDRYVLDMNYTMYF